MADLEQVEARAIELIDRYLPGAGWRFRWDNSRRRAGVCIFGTREIHASRPLAVRWNAQRCEQVILHEIAHALAGPRAGHGRAWVRVAESIGCRRERYDDAGLARESAPIVGCCPNGHEFFRYRMPSGPRSCSLCHRGFDARFLITWRRRAAQ